MPHPRIALVGLASWDRLLVVDRHAGPGEYAIVVREASLPGGTTTNTAVALARLGAAVAFAGLVGDNEAGVRMRTALAAEGMRRYGFRDEAAVVCNALLDAAQAFSNQLPEVFAGFPRDETSVPVEYPGALKPQSWAAASPLLAIRTLLGLEVSGGRLRSRPHLPASMPKLQLRHVTVHGKEMSTAR